MSDREIMDAKGFGKQESSKNTKPSPKYWNFFCNYFAKNTIHIIHQELQFLPKQLH